MPQVKASSDEEYDLDASWPQDVLDLLQGEDKAAIEYIRDLGEPKYVAKHLRDNTSTWTDIIMKSVQYKKLPLAKRIKMEAILLETWPDQDEGRQDASQGQQRHQVKGGASAASAPHTLEVPWTLEQVQQFRKRFPPSAELCRYKWERRMVELVEVLEAAIKDKQTPKDTILALQGLMQSCFGEAAYTDYSDQIRVKECVQVLGFSGVRAAQAIPGGKDRYSKAKHTQQPNSASHTRDTSSNKGSTKKSLQVLWCLALGLPMPDKVWWPIWRW